MIIRTPHLGVGLYFTQVMLYKYFVVEKALTPWNNLVVSFAFARECNRVKLRHWVDTLGVMYNTTYALDKHPLKHINLRKSL